MESLPYSERAINITKIGWRKAREKLQRYLRRFSDSSLEGENGTLLVYGLVYAKPLLS